MLDETKNQQDTSERDTSEGKGGTSKEPETFTKEQAQEMTQKAISDALAKAGRDAKSLEQRDTALKAKEEKFTQEARARREKELDDNRDNVDALTNIRAKHKRDDLSSEYTKLQSELEVEKEKGKQRDTEIAKSTQEIRTREIATLLNVDTKTLSKLSKFTDGSDEAIKGIAEGLPKKGEPKPLVKPDSGRTIGGEQEKKSASQSMKAGFDKLHS